MKVDNWIAKLENGKWNKVHLEQLYEDIQMLNKRKIINISIDEDGIVIRLHKIVLDTLNKGSKIVYRDIDTDRIIQIRVLREDESN